tara:strand:+ start:61 stop:597 length:537 start_codon:yes stop_codon:yes gene_type:complete
MKKNLLFLLLIHIVTNSFSQKKELFKPGANIVENTIVSEFNSKSSILFIFKDDTHLINFYLDLARNIKKQFRKSRRKVKFNYELFSKKPFELDLKSMPKKTFKKVNFDIICSISTTFNGGWDNDITGGRKQNYNLNLRIVESKKNILLESAKIKINSVRTIITQNINSSKLIYNLITN